MTIYQVPVLSQFVWQPPVIDKDLDTPPGGEAKGDRYIVASGADAWAGHDGEIATYNGSGWDFTSEKEGMITWVKDEDLLYSYDGSDWAEFGGGGGGLVQMVSDTDATEATLSTGFPDDDTIPQIGEGDEVLSVAITPLFASSTILIFYHVPAVKANTTFAVVALFSSVGSDALHCGSYIGTQSVAGVFSEAALNKNVRTYSVRVGDSTGNNIDYLAAKFGGKLISTIKVLEILP